MSKLTFVRGSDYQPSPEYNYKLYMLATEHNTKNAVVRQVKSPLFSGSIYPGLQALDGQYLGVDFQFGGVDQTAQNFHLHRAVPAYAKRAHRMNAMVPGTMGGEMSSSDPDSRIDFLNPPEVVKRKINKAFREEGNVTQNGLVSSLLRTLFSSD